MRKWSEERRKKGSGFKGKVHREESKIKTSRSCKLNPNRYWAGKIRGPLSEDTKEKIRLTKMGNKNPMFGKPSPRRGVKLSKETKLKVSRGKTGTKYNLSEETKQKKREVALRNLPALLASDKNWDSPERNRKISESKKLQWQDIEWKERVLKKVFASNEIKPNKAEFYMDSLIQTARPTDFIYSGNGEIFIGGKCPDWFNVNGKKQVIELFGNYFHSKLVTGRTKRQEEKQRLDHFAKYGYKTLVIWESELKNPDKLTQKIQNF
jgi:G:T-mismatch repair DNA endonuclease (very short patch repair protein)